MKNEWNVTFDIVTEESAQDGEAAESGYVAEDVSLREAVEAFFEAADDPHIEANEYPVSESVQWFTCYDGVSGRIREDGTDETRSLHIPKWVSGPSRIRLARVLGCCGRY